MGGATLKEELASGSSSMWGKIHAPRGLVSAPVYCPPSPCFPFCPGKPKLMLTIVDFWPGNQALVPDRWLFSFLLHFMRCYSKFTLFFSFLILLKVFHSSLLPPPLPILLKTSCLTEISLQWWWVFSLSSYPFFWPLRLKVRFLKFVFHWFWLVCRHGKDQIPYIDPFVAGKISWS